MTLWSHRDAVTNALRRGVAPNDKEGQGNGPAGTDEIAKANGGSFVLWTGDVTFKVKKGKDDGFVSHAEAPGTGLHLSLDTTKPVDLSDTFIQGVAYTHIEATAERLEDSGGFKVKDECVSTGTRQPALALRRKVMSVLPDMEGPLEIDFEGVRSAASSFLDELLGRTVAEIGKEKFSERIKIVNAGDDIIKMANVVIEQRLEGTQQPMEAEDD